MSYPSLPQDVAFVLPFVSTGLVHYLQSDHQKAWINAVIALVFFVGTAVGCAWLSGNFLFGSPQASVLAVISFTGILMRGGLSSVVDYLAALPSPLDAAAPKPPPAPQLVTPQASQK